MRSAVRMSLFAGQERREKLDGIGDPQQADGVRSRIVVFRAADRSWSRQLSHPFDLRTRYNSRPDPTARERLALRVW